MATIKVSTTTSCSRAINYAEKRAEVKDGVNCDVDHAKQEMSMVREMHGKTDGTQAHLIIQSFSPEESQQLGAEKINQLGIELAEKIAPDHQIAVYTHVDKEHFHNHIVINSVNLETGNKYHQHKEFNHVKGLNDEILKQHHLEIVQPQKHYEKLTSAEVQIKRRGGTPWKGEVRRKIDEIMKDRSVSSYQAFRERLKENGVIVHDRGKNVTYELLEGNKKVRGNKLGSSYERETITQALESRTQAKEIRAKQALTRQEKPTPRISNKIRSMKKQDILQKQHKEKVRMNLKNSKLSFSTKPQFEKFKAPKPLEAMSLSAYFAPPLKLFVKTIQTVHSLSKSL